MQIKGEVGISTNVRSQIKKKLPTKTPALLLITATGSGSGKTFIVTGLAGALKKKGFNIGVIKVGGDIRDVVPALYLIKEPIKNYSSIRIGDSGWKSIHEVMEGASQNYDFLLIEGAMSAFTGLFNDKVERPTSTAEVALALDAPTIVVVGCEKEGIEGAVINALNYANLMKRLGIKVEGVILNKARVSYMTDEVRLLIERAFKNVGVELLGVVPRIELEGRGMIPEVEIRYEEFGTKAIEAAENFLNLNMVIELAKPPKKVLVSDDKAFSEKFKNYLITDFNHDASKGGTAKDDCRPQV